MHEPLLALYRDHFGARPRAILALRGDGSSRIYRRLVGSGGRTAIGVIGPDRDENRAFLAYSRAFRGAGLPVPEVYAADEQAGAWLLEDLGDTTLFDAIEEGRTEAGGAFPETLVPVYRRVVEWLPRFQVDGHRVVDYSVAYPRAAFDRQSVVWDLNYFKYHFLKLAQIPFGEARLEEDFDRLAAFLLEADTEHFLYRDFQSRNVMLRAGGEPWFIDYQGGRRGALQYDIASLLYDAKADLPQRLRDALLDHYLGALAERTEIDPDRFRALYPGYVLIRILQALGAYGYRGFFERKPHFLRSVPYAARNLERLLEHGLPIDLPELSDVIRRIAGRWADGDGEAEPSGAAASARDAHAVEPGSGDPAPARATPAVARATPAVARAAADGARAAADGHRGGAEGEAGSDAPARGLTVEVYSFSYRRGYPADTAGHGGGFVFDCRALPNPGRLDEYRHLSGRDAEVAAFIDSRPEMRAYWEHVTGLADAQVEAYVRRGFSSLTIAFGCTGGQHRSVYLAERLAAHLRERHSGVRVHVHHRDEAHWEREEAADSWTP